MNKIMLRASKSRWSSTSFYGWGLISMVVGVGMIFPNLGEKLSPDSVVVTGIVVTEPVADIYQPSRNREVVPVLQERFDVLLADGTVQQASIRGEWIERIDADKSEVVSLWKVKNTSDGIADNLDLGLRATPAEFRERFVVTPSWPLVISGGSLMLAGYFMRRIADRKLDAAFYAASSKKVMPVNTKPTVTKVATPSAAAPTMPSQQLVAEQIRLAKIRHDKVLFAYGKYECSALEVFTRPALADVSEPTTAAFLSAMDRADSARAIVDGAGRQDIAQAAERYDSAVIAFAQTWREADANAEKVKQTRYSHTNRKRLRTACLLLTQAQSCEEGSPERAVFTERARETVKNLVRLPPKTKVALEAARVKKSIHA